MTEVYLQGTGMRVLSSHGARPVGVQGFYIVGVRVRVLMRNACLMHSCGFLCIHRT